MPLTLKSDELISVTLTVDDWAQVVAAVALSQMDLTLKERVNSKVFECVGNRKRVSLR